MNEREYQALLSILARTPVSPAEALWLDSLLERLRPQPEPQPEMRDGRP